MAKSKQPETRELTRKHQAHKRRDDERNRWLLIGLGIVAGILLLIIAVGVIQELVIKPRQPIATVNGTNIASNDYGKRVRFAWYQEANRYLTPRSRTTRSGSSRRSRSDDRRETAAGASAAAEHHGQP